MGLHPASWGVAGRRDALRGFDTVLGMNARNAHIAEQNPRAAVRLVNDKQATKDALRAAGSPTSDTILLVEHGSQLRDAPWRDLPDEWALKPNQGLGGNGIMLAAGRDGDRWHTASCRAITALDVKDHMRSILDGEFSGRSADAALVEPLIHAHPELDRLSYRGLPDIRVMCLGPEPRLAMMRLPTARSGGRANLHQQAIGAAVDLDTGRVVRAWAGGRELHDHPDTGEHVVGALVPCWSEVVDAASRCAAATGLRYLGADIVVDRDRGPLVLEVNARPGLQVQNVTGQGLMQLVEQEAA